MSEVNLYTESARGAQAQSWLESPMTKEAFSTVRNGILDRWAESPIEDKEGQYTLRLMLKCLDDAHKNIVQVAITGEMAKQQIAHEKSLKDRAKDFLSQFGVRV